MKNQSILLVEDNPDGLKLTVRAFGKSKLANPVIVATDGVKAVDYLFGTGDDAGRDLTDMPAVILLDLKLPRLSGLEGLRRLRAGARTKRLPIVVMTSSREEPDVVASYDLGANSYVRKPVDFEQFRAAIDNLGLYWLALNEAPPNAEGSK